MGADFRPARRAELEPGTSFLLRDRFGQPVRQQDNVVAPISERRQVDGDDVEAIEQVFAKAPLGDFAQGIAIGGADDADIDRFGLCRSDSLDHPGLDEPQQLDLKLDLHFTNLVEEQRAAIGGLGSADPVLDCSGEGAFDMAEQFALEQVLRNRAAIDRDESLVPAARFRVQRLGGHFLARPAFAGDEDARARIGDLLDRAEHGAHDGRLADKAMEAGSVLDRLDDGLGRRGF